MAKSTATSAHDDLKRLLELLRSNGVRRYRAADGLEIEIDPAPAALPAGGDDDDDLPDELRRPRAAVARGGKAKKKDAPRRRPTVMEEPDLYPDGVVPSLEELDS